MTVIYQRSKSCGPMVAPSGTAVAGTRQILYQARLYWYPVLHHHGASNARQGVHHGFQRHLIDKISSF